MLYRYFAAIILTVLTWSTFSQAATPVLTIGSTNGIPGQTVTVPVTLATNGVTISAVSIDIAFDTTQLSVAMNSAVPPYPTAAVAGIAATAAQKTVIQFIPISGVLRLGIVGFDGVTGNQTAIGDGTIANVTFTIAPTASGNISLTNTANATNTTMNAEPIAIAGTNSIITLMSTAKTNGVCGSSNSSLFTVAPSFDLCSTGSATIVSGIGPWNWTCVGVNGGTSASCSATKSTSLDTTAPAFVLSTLANNAVTDKPILNVAGTISDSVSGIKLLTINGQPVTPKNNGTFSVAVPLANGDNTITTTVTDNVNNFASDIRTIIFNKTVIPLTITQPADNSATGNNYVAVTGTVNDPNTTVSVKVNGGSTTTAAMSGINFNATLNLLSGQNTIEIKATDQAGISNNSKRTITSNVSSPTLAVTVPSQDTNTTLSTFIISGVVTDVVTSSTISIAVGSQTYKPTVAPSGSFSQSIQLAADNIYSVIVTATDQAGNSATVQRNIIKISPLTQPTLSDALKVLQAVAGITKLTALEQIHYDVAPLGNNGMPVGNGVLDAADVILILRRSIGIGSW